MMIEAAAQSEVLKAIVAEGASSRSVRDDLANPGGGWQDTRQRRRNGRDRPLQQQPSAGDAKSLVPKIAPRAVFFVYGEHGQPTEQPANNAFYAAAGVPKGSGRYPARNTSAVSTRSRANTSGE